MDNWQEQMLIRAEIEALLLIKKHLEIIQSSMTYGLDVDFTFAKLDAEQEAEQKSYKLWLGQSSLGKSVRFSKVNLYLERSVPSQVTAQIQNVSCKLNQNSRPKIG